MAGETQRWRAWRIGLSAMAGAVAAAGIGLAVVGAGGSTSQSARPHPTLSPLQASTAVTLAPVGSPSAAGAGPPGTTGSAAAGQVPVLLIHGYTGSQSDVTAYAQLLRQRGRSVVLVALPQQGTADIRASARVFADAARQTRAPVIDVIGYSLGGLVARDYLAEHLAGPDVRRMVLVSTPSGGASVGPPPGGSCGADTACGELQPNSSFLSSLVTQIPPAEAWLSISSRTDRLVSTASAAVNGARNIVVQDVCPGDDSSHGSIRTDPTAIGLAVLFLDDQLPDPPPSCATVQAASR